MAGSFGCTRSLNPVVPITLYIFITDSHRMMAIGRTDLQEASPFKEDLVKESLLIEG